MGCSTSVPSTSGTDTNPSCMCPSVRLLDNFYSWCEQGEYSLTVAGPRVLGRRRMRSVERFVSTVIDDVSVSCVSEDQRRLERSVRNRSTLLTYKRVRTGPEGSWVSL